MMRHRTISYAISLCFACGLLMLVGGAALSQAQGGPVEEFLAKMQERRDKVRSVRYVMTGKGMTAKGVFADPSSRSGKKAPEKDHHFDIRLSLLDFEKNRVRKEFSGQVFHSNDRGFVTKPNRYTHVYDGSGSKRLFPREENSNSEYAPPERGAELGIIKNGNTVDMEDADFPVFLSNGVIPTTRHPVDSAKQLRQSLDATDYQVRGRAELLGQTCTILRTAPSSTPGLERNYEDFWVEPQRGLVLRQDRFLDGELYVRTDIEYQAENLKSWVTTEFKNNYGQARAKADTRPAIPPGYVAGQVVRASRLTVQEFEANPALKAEDFDVAIKPGMNVTVVDAAAKLETEFDKKDYRVAANGRTLEELRDGIVDPENWTTS